VEWQNDRENMFNNALHTVAGDVFSCPGITRRHRVNANVMPQRRHPREAARHHSLNAIINQAGVSSMRQMFILLFLLALSVGCGDTTQQRQAAQARQDAAIAADLTAMAEAMHNDPNNQVSENIDEPLNCVPQYVALREYEFETDKPAESMVRCDFRCISFEIPSKLAAQTRIVRSSPSSIWLVFEDRGRFMQIPLPSPQLASKISDPPPELVSATVPGMLATIAAVASGDSSSELTPSEHSAYDWAIANRESIGLDKPMDRFAVRSSGTLHAILFSANPSAELPEKQIRSWLVWQETGSGKTGSMMFSDSNADNTGWINSFAASIEFMPNVKTNDLTANDYAAMGDDAILSMLNTHSPNHP